MEMSSQCLYRAFTPVFPHLGNKNVHSQKRNRNINAATNHLSPMVSSLQKFQGNSGTNLVGVTNQYLI